MKHLRLLWRIIFLIALQIFIFNRLVLFDWGIFFVYTYAIITLPIEWKKWQVLLCSFFIGFVIDYFAGTHGLHMISATALGFARLLFLQLFVRELKDEIGDYKINFEQLPVLPFFLYSLVSIFFFCALFFLADYFSTMAFERLLTSVLASTFCTVLIHFTYRFLFTYRVKH